MGTVWKCCVVAVVFCDLSSFGLDSPSDPGRGFQFNCGQDLCTFPHQYCDTDDYRCLYCSDDLCHTKDLPDQCRSYCKGNHGINYNYCSLNIRFFLNFSLLDSFFFCVLSFLNVHVSITNQCRIKNQFIDNTARPLHHIQNIKYFSYFNRLLYFYDNVNVETFRFYYL